MNISEETKKVLKNFSDINNSILIRKGSVIRTVDPEKNILGVAYVQEAFPKEFAIYELNKLLGVITLFDEPDLEFFDEDLTIKSGRRKVKYAYAEPDAIVSAPNKDIEIEDKDVYEEFDITAKDFHAVIKASGVLGLEHFVIEGDGEKIRLKTTNLEQSNSNDYNIEVGNTDKTFRVVFSVRHLIKIMTRDFNVMVSSKGVVRFKSPDVTYFVACTKKLSEFE